MSDTVQPEVKVLFVDDEENILRSLERLFMDQEYPLLTAASGEEGLRLLEANPDIGLIVSDQRMPGMSGVEFLARARQAAPETLRIVLTGYADLHATMDAINRGGAYRYITKPWNDDDLLQTIRDALTHCQLLQANRRLTEQVNRQNEELKEWNSGLKSRVLEQTTTIRKQNEELSAKNEHVQETFNKTIVAFSRLVELCGMRLKNHAQNVAELSVNVARELGLPAKEVETIRTAALLHDIGKIGIPEVILDKKAAEMNGKEKRIYMQHTVRGQTAIDVVEDLREAGVLIRHHHEHYNGKGFPDGLAGDAIPLGARIITIADCLDREIGDMRDEMALEVVLGKMTLQLGLVFDPSLMSHFKRYARYVYYANSAKLREGIETELHPNELIEGLTITRDAYSGTGLLLLSKGMVLDRTMIQSIRRYHEIDPAPQGIFVMSRR